MLKMKKGFTLVELMIVVAIIALLMIVLVPAMGLIKNKTREAGIRSNIAMMTGIIHSVIDDYAADTDSIPLLEERIAADIESVKITEQMLKNPVTKGDKVGTTAVLATSMVAAYTAGDQATGIEDDVTGGWTTTINNSAGVIAYGAYVKDGRLEVKLIPYGVDNKIITALVEDISQ